MNLQILFILKSLLHTKNDYKKVNIYQKQQEKTIKNLIKMWVIFWNKKIRTEEL